MFPVRPSLLTDLGIPLLGADTGMLFSLSKGMSNETPWTDDLIEIRIKKGTEQLTVINKKNEIFVFGFKIILSW